MTFWHYFFLVSYLLWCIMWTKLINYVYDVRVGVYKRISPEIKKKYYEFGRWDFEKYQKLPKLLNGYTCLPLLRIILLMLTFIFTYLSLRIILLGSDLQKPLPKWKRFC
jgi:hypothetical protein